MLALARDAAALAVCRRERALEAPALLPHDARDHLGHLESGSACVYQQEGKRQGQVQPRDGSQVGARNLDTGTRSSTAHGDAIDEKLRERRRLRVITDISGRDAKGAASVHTKLGRGQGDLVLAAKPHFCHSPVPRAARKKPPPALTSRPRRGPQAASVASPPATFPCRRTGAGLPITRPHGGLLRLRRKDLRRRSLAPHARPAEGQSSSQPEKGTGMSVRQLHQQFFGREVRSS